MRKEVRRVWIVAALVLSGCGIALCLSFLNLSPEGRFRVDEWGSSALAYFEFKDGRAYIVVKGSYRSEMGEYRKEGNQWLLVGDYDTNTLKANFWEIEISSLDGQQYKKLPRTFRR